MGGRKACGAPTKFARGVTPSPPETTANTDADRQGNSPQIAAGTTGLRHRKPMDLAGERQVCTAVSWANATSF
jgi:hypothetical protein